MNDRIRDLLGQAYDEAVPETWTTLSSDQLGRIYEKFAELIVRQCARVIDRGDGEMSSMAETIWCNVCRDDILKHFGVEE